MPLETVRRLVPWRRLFETRFRRFFEPDLGFVKIEVGHGDFHQAVGVLVPERLVGRRLAEYPPVRATASGDRDMPFPGRLGRAQTGDGVAIVVQVNNLRQLVRPVRAQQGAGFQPVARTTAP